MSNNINNVNILCAGKDSKLSPNIPATNLTMYDVKSKGHRVLPLERPCQKYRHSFPTYWD